jgi:FkbM family methyltransferase
MRLTRSVTASLPRIKGVGVLLAVVATYFRKQNLSDIEVVVFGSKMLLNPSDLIGNSLVFTPNYYDRLERRQVEEILGSGDYAIDVGANVGAYTLLFARLVGSGGLVTAVEAERGNAQRLQHNLDLNSMRWVEVHHCGVSDRMESLPLLLNSTGNGGGHSFYEQSDASAPPVQHVSCCPLFELLNNARKPRFMKLDIEGFEYRVLKRYFEDAPRHLWPDFILLEDNESRREGDAVSLVVGHGYRILARHDFNVFLQIRNG